MLRFFLLFLAIQAALFGIELLGPVQQGFVMPFTGLLADISARLFRILTPQQRWHLGARAQVPGRLPRNGLPDDEEPAWQVATQEPGPGDLVEELQEQQRLREALSQLPADQRLLLRLRYEQGLTLAEVARLTRQPDPFRANRRIQAALDALGSLMGAGRSGPGRKNR